MPVWSAACLYPCRKQQLSPPPSRIRLLVLSGIFSRITNANDLKDALDLSATRTKAIATRVSQASVNNGSGFALPIDPATGKPPVGDGVDLEAEMTALADEQLRFEATAKLLEKTYAQMRTAMKER